MIKKLHNRIGKKKKAKNVQQPPRSTGRWDHIKHHYSSAEFKKTFGISTEHSHPFLTELSITSKRNS